MVEKKRYRIIFKADGAQWDGYCIFRPEEFEKHGIMAMELAGCGPDHEKFYITEEGKRECNKSPKE